MYQFSYDIHNFKILRFAIKGAGDIFLTKFRVPKGRKQSNPLHQNRKWHKKAFLCQCHSIGNIHWKYNQRQGWLLHLWNYGPWSFPPPTSFLMKNWEIWPISWHAQNIQTECNPSFDYITHLFHPCAVFIYLEKCLPYV